MNIQTARSAASTAVAYPFVALHRRAIARGDLSAIPLSLWHTLPTAMQKWIDRRILKPGDEFAWTVLEADPSLVAASRKENRNWALSPSSRLYIGKMVRQNRPRRIIEFGCGQSTMLFATLAKQLEVTGTEVRVYSVEHDASWADSVRKMLVEQALDEYVEVIDAPLTSQWLLGREMTAYEIADDVLQTAAGERGFDLCLIDGPTGRIGRAGSLAIAAPHLADGAAVFLDDAYRSGEYAVVREWVRTWPESLTRPRLLMADRHGLVEMQWQRGDLSTDDRTTPAPTGRGPV